MFNLEEELKKLPDKPGVYIMKDVNTNTLYIGKAVSLKNRIKSYFRKSNKTVRIEKMVSLVDHFEYIVTDSEAEALILECNLIKKNLPKFNVLLKDDKTYPYIRVDVKSDYPNVYITRTFKNDGAKYFGPYANGFAAKEMMKFIKERFKLKQCKNFKQTKRECLNYHIEKCSGACMGHITKEEYKKQIDQIIMLLEGKISGIVKQVDQEIKELAEVQEYEKAASLRDKKAAILYMLEKQKVSNLNENSIDVIGVAANELLACIEVFFVRNSKMVGREHYFFENVTDVSNKDILSEFIKQYYLDKVDLPSKIMIETEIEDMNLIEGMLGNVKFKIPQKGEKLRFIEMAKNNAQITLENKTKEKEDILNSLKKTLELKELPRKIECFDISNLAGTFGVGAMCVVQDGVIKRNLARRFKLKTVVRTR